MDNPTDYIVHSDATLITAMTQIDFSEKGIVFVVDKATHGLLGSLSDGDVRRYLLQDGSLSSNVTQTMNKNPIKANSGRSFSELEKILEEKQIDAIPLVDTEGRIESIYFKGDHEKIVPKEQLCLPVVIMAGGKGTRLAPYTYVLPKPLIPVSGKTIIEHIMDQFIEYGCDQFSIIVNYRKNLIKAFFQDEASPYQVAFIDEFEFQGTGGGLSLLEEKINGTFFMTNCDILVDCDFSDLLNYHRENKHILTMVGAEMSMTVPYGTVISDESGNVNGFTEKPSYDFVANTGVYLIEPEFLDYIPKNTFIHITDVIEKCISAKQSIGVYKIKEDAWLDMGQHESLAEMVNKLQNKEK